MDAYSDDEMSADDGMLEFDDDTPEEKQDAVDDEKYPFKVLSTSQVTDYMGDQIKKVNSVIRVSFLFNQVPKIEYTIV